VRVKHYVDDARITVVKRPNEITMVIERGEQQVVTISFYPESFYLFFIKLMRLVISDD